MNLQQQIKTFIGQVHIPMPAREIAKMIGVPKDTAALTMLEMSRNGCGNRLLS